MKEHAVVTKCGFSFKQVKVWVKDYNITASTLIISTLLTPHLMPSWRTVKNQLGMVGYEHSWPTGLTPA